MINIFYDISDLETQDEIDVLYNIVNEINITYDYITSECGETFTRWDLEQVVSDLSYGWYNADDTDIESNGFNMAYEIENDGLVCIDTDTTAISDDTPLGAVWIAYYPPRMRG